MVRPGEAATIPALTQDDEAAIRAIVAGLETSWNAADGAAYGAYFADDADFVNIYGRYFSGRATIAAGHQRIFDTVYRGSVNSGALQAVRALGPGLALAHVAWHLRVPVDEAVREMRSQATLVLTQGPTGGGSPRSTTRCSASPARSEPARGGSGRARNRNPETTTGKETSAMKTA